MAEIKAVRVAADDYGLYVVDDQGRLWYRENGREGWTLLKLPEAPPA